MLKNQSLKTQLNLSFGILVVLLVIISVVAYSGLSNTYQGFTDYRGLARDTNLAGRVQANMLTMRLSVLSFLNTRSDQALADYQERKALMTSFLEEASKEIVEPSRAQLIRNIKTEIQDYDTAFAEVVKLFHERNQVVSGRLDPAGLAMRVAVTDIARSAYDDEDASAAYMAGVVQEHLLLGRLYVTKFLVTNTQDDANRAEQELNQTLVSAMTELDSQLQNPKRRQLLADLQRNHAQYTKAFTEVQNIIVRRNDLINNTLNRIGPVVADQIEQVKLSVKNEQDALGPVVQTEAENTLIMVGVIALCSVLGGVVLAMLMVRIIQRPIGGEPRVIAKVAEVIANGDLSQNLSVKSEDTGIYRAVCEMSEKLKTLLSGIVVTTQQLERSAEEGSDAASRNTQTVNQQKKMTDQVVVAVEEMSHSIQEVVQNAAESAARSEQGKAETSRGRSSVKQTVQAINELANKLNTSMQEIKELEQKSMEIGSVVEVIQGISEQTNLLALNAAIEAARAGEQGRGFAVVADEVRTLAQRTQESTTEIQAMIQDLQQRTSRTVSAIKNCTDQANDSVQCSQETDQALQVIDEVIDEIAHMNNRVAVAIEQQSTVTDEMARNMAEISSTLESTTESVLAAEKASKKVEEMADSLGKLVSGFKV
ncbi:methyl-accepting chemotaxis protein [Oceanospirillum multiglobuliferum]|uniref:Methyl-accepting transducer domain-containing protein n=1 Tax=Oceanospirillum multiglobuliferum TaxID=64969 RepID=A0A1T4R4D3_9GAMM|nr:methyl-accepting chemotaxis protein [Oceanospirillum multiglobuliferum]OPX55247.1 hypothetical protein BTE48_09955 [Oceanospirillum multiglobuliferum]SKA10725.1 methyl-accepting chemotaxis protein [Oceanospirillum multiglobuliferum]